jgi:PhnB protein
MSERDLIQGLDRAVDLLLSGVDHSDTDGTDIASMIEIAADLRLLPSGDFRAKLKTRLLRPPVARETAAWKPEGFRAVTPYLHPRSAAELIDFMKRAFGAQELARHTTPSGRVMQAVVKIGDSMIEMGEPDEPEPSTLHIFVPDTDAAYRRALEEGAEAVLEPADSYYDQRLAAVRDAAHNVWLIGTQRTGKYIPEGFGTVTPYLKPQSSKRLIEFLLAAFNANEVLRTESETGRVFHARVRIGDSIIEMGDASEAFPKMPAALHFFVPDADEIYRRAIAAGGTSIREPRDYPYGQRLGIVLDPGDNRWYIATQIAGGPDKI